jgi:hypothetical protein
MFLFVFWPVNVCIAGGSSENTNYFKVSTIEEMLKNTGLDTANLLGRRKH